MQFTRLRHTLSLAFCVWHSSFTRTASLFAHRPTRMVQEGASHHTSKGEDLHTYSKGHNGEYHGFCEAMPTSDLASRIS